MERPYVTGWWLAQEGSSAGKLPGKRLPGSGTVSWITLSWRVADPMLLLPSDQRRIQRWNAAITNGKTPASSLPVDESTWFNLQATGHPIMTLIANPPVMALPLTAQAPQATSQQLLKIFGPCWQPDRTFVPLSSKPLVKLRQKMAAAAEGAQREGRIGASVLEAALRGVTMLNEKGLKWDVPARVRDTKVLGLSNQLSGKDPEWLVIQIAPSTERCTLAWQEIEALTGNVAAMLADDPQIAGRWWEISAQDQASIAQGAQASTAQGAQASTAQGAHTTENGTGGDDDLRRWILAEAAWHILHNLSWVTSDEQGSGKAGASSPEQQAKNLRARYLTGMHLWEMHRQLTLPDNRWDASEKNLIEVRQQVSRWSKHVGMSHFPTSALAGLTPQALANVFSEKSA